MTKHKVYLGLGTNLGQRSANLRKAIRLIDHWVGRVVRQSSFIDSKPQGFKSTRRFLNAAILIETDYTPRRVLELTQEIESDMGRKTKSVDGQYADRIIDIDILMYDDVHIDEPDLKIPHPLMHERDFVMIPLGEIAPPGQVTNY